MITASLLWQIESDYISFTAFFNSLTSNCWWKYDFYEFTKRNTSVALMYAAHKSECRTTLYEDIWRWKMIAMSQMRRRDNFDVMYFKQLTSCCCCCYCVFKMAINRESVVYDLEKVECILKKLIGEDVLVYRFMSIWYIFVKKLTCRRGKFPWQGKLHHMQKQLF